MPILDSCCCSSNLKTASIITAYYTLIFYTILLTTGSFHIHTVMGTKVLFPVTVTMVVLSVLLVICSIILIIGLHGDNRGMMVPWLMMMTTTTVFDVAVSAYLLSDTEFNPFVITLFVIDFLFCGLNIYCFLCVISQYQIYRKRSKKEKKVRLRRKRRERLRSGFAIEGEDGFDLEDGEEYEEDLDDYDDDMASYAYGYGIHAGVAGEEDRILRLDRQRNPSSSTSSQHKKNSIQRLHRQTHDAAAGAETRRSYTGSAMTSKRSVSPIASLPSTPSSRDSSNDDDEGDVFSGTVSGTAVKTINVPSSGAVKAHSQTSPSRILLQPPSPSSGDFNRNNKSIVGSKNVTSQPHRSSIRSSKSEGDPMMRSRHSFSRVSPTTVRVPSKTVVNRTLS